MYRWSDVFCAGLFVVCVGSYSIVIPWNGGPDEVTHFFLLEYLYKFGELPRPGIDPVEPFIGILSGHEFRSSDFWYWGIPFVNVLGAWATAHLFAPLLPNDLGFLGARAFNWFLAVPFALAVIAVARTFVPNRWLGLVAAGSVLLIPQVIFIFSTFNSDAFGVTVVAVTLLAFERVRHSPTLGRSFIFGLGCGLILTTKLYFFPSLVFFSCIYGLQAARGRISWDSQKIGATIAALVLAAAPMLILTYVQYGEVTGASGQFYFSELNRSKATAGYGTCYLLCDGMLWNWANVSAWVRLVYASFFGVLGWMNIFLPSVFYQKVFPFIGLSLLILTTLRIAQTALTDRRRNTLLVEMSVRLALFWLMVLFTVLLSLISSQMTLPQPQGRYIFVVIPFLPLVIGALISPHWDEKQG